MSNQPHLRHQRGGDPSQGPDDSIANEPVAPAVDNTFPDAPDETGGGADQDKPDLDKFAARMGTDTIGTGEGLSAVPEREPGDAVNDGASSNISPTDFRVLGVAGGVASGVVVWLVGRRKKKHALLRAAGSLAVVKGVTSVIGD